MNDVNSVLFIWQMDLNGRKTKHVSHFISFEASGFIRNAHILTFMQQFLNLFCSAILTLRSNAETLVEDNILNQRWDTNCSSCCCFGGIRPYNEPDWNETMGCRCEPSGRCDAAQRLPAWERSNKRQKMSTNREHKCNTTWNQRELITLTC